MMSPFMIMNKDGSNSGIPLVPIYEVTYHNMPMDANIKVITDDKRILAAFLKQLETNECIATISGKTETIRTYMGPKPDPKYDPECLQLYKSEIVESDGSHKSLYLSSLLMSNMVDYVSSIVTFDTKYIPYELEKLYPDFFKGEFRGFMQTVITAAYIVLVDSDDSCLDTIRTICNVDMLLGSSNVLVREWEGGL